MNFDELSRRLASLTKREENFVRMKCAGKTTKEIAYECFVQEQTVKNALTVAFYKLCPELPSGVNRGFSVCHSVGCYDGAKNTISLIAAAAQRKRETDNDGL